MVPFSGGDISTKEERRLGGGSIRRRRPVRGARKVSIWEVQSRDEDAEPGYHGVEEQIEARMIVEDIDDSSSSSEDESDDEFDDEFETSLSPTMPTQAVDQLPATTATTTLKNTDPSIVMEAVTSSPTPTTTLIPVIEEVMENSDSTRAIATPIVTGEPTIPLIGFMSTTAVGDSSTVNAFMTEVPVTMPIQAGAEGFQPTGTAGAIQSAVETSTSTVLLGSATQPPAFFQTSSPGSAQYSESDRDDGDYFERPPPPQQSNQSTDHLLIALGAIGAFILFCFVAFVGYRFLRGRSNGARGLDALFWRRGGPNAGNGFGWVSNNGPSVNNNMGSRPGYGSSGMGPYYGSSQHTSVDKVYAMPMTSGATSVNGASSTDTFRQAHNEQTVASLLQQYGYGFELRSERNTLQSQPEQLQKEQPPLPQPPQSESQYSQPELARQPSVARTKASFVTEAPIAPPQPAALPQSRFSQTATSVSSGFPDTEPEPMPQALRPPPRASVIREGSPYGFAKDDNEDDLAGYDRDREQAPYPERLSWSSQADRPLVGGRGDNDNDGDMEAGVGRHPDGDIEGGGTGTESRRETMYTTTSEDRPARFRSIGSWVNQQTGRVKRADWRAKERGDVPVMPALPGAINYTHQTAYR